jgi:hypothetical protein
MTVKTAKWCVSRATATRRRDHVNPVGPPSPTGFFYAQGGRGRIADTSPGRKPGDARPRASLALAPGRSVSMTVPDKLLSAERFSRSREEFSSCRGH